MLKTSLKIRNVLATIITVLSPALAIILLYIFNWNIAGFIAKFSTGLAEALKNKPALEFTISSAFITIVVNLIIKFLKFKGKLTIDIQGKRSRKETTYIDVNNPHRQPSIDIDCHIDFAFPLLRKIIAKLGGIKLVISFPHWANYTIENKGNFQRKDFTESKEEITIYLEEALQKKVKDGKIFIALKVAAKLEEKNEGKIVSEFMFISDGKFKKFLLGMLMFIFFDLKDKHHLIEARTDND